MPNEAKKQGPSPYERLASAIEKISERLDKIESKEVAPPPVSVPVVPTSETTPVTEESKFPIPEEYLTSLKTTLNQDFGIKVEPFSDRPAFLFTVVVPDKYSAISVTDRSIIKADLRSKVIPYAEGVNGVREWMNLIYNSFDPAVQARITADRVY